MAARLRLVAIAIALAALAWGLLPLRRAFIQAVIHFDAPPGAGPALRRGDGAGLPPAAFTRVILIDGAGADTAARMPAWSRLCARGADLVVDVGFPTVSLPVQVSLWTGRWQAETGVVFRSGLPLVPPLGPAGIPAQVAGSVAVAEASPYIVQSLGFATVLPPGAAPAGWGAGWLAAARAAVTSDARLAFVHVLRVDATGHRHGQTWPAWPLAAAYADAAVDALVTAGDAAHPDARWFVLADHGHLPGGGHGGEEPALRRVRACIAGGVAPVTGGPIALVDLSRALADSVGAALPASAGRPLEAALRLPLGDHDAVPGLPWRRAAAALAVVLIGAALAGWRARRELVVAAAWWPLAIALVALGAAPTMSTPATYAPQGREIAAALWPALLVLAPSIALGFARRPPWRVLAAGLALPAAALVASAIACGAAPLVVGVHVAPVAPRWTAWTSAGFVVLASGCAVVALAALATAVRPRSDRGAPPAPRRSGP